MSYKPEMTSDEEEGKKALPVISHSQYGQADCKVVENESVEMIPLKVHNESQGKHSYSRGNMLVCLLLRCVHWSSFVNVEWLRIPPAITSL